MKISIVKADTLDVMYEAAGVCRNSANASKALEHSIKAGHDSILEHASVTFKISGISRATSHQLVRHRIASYAQQSQRHTKLEFASAQWFIRPPTIEQEEYEEHMREVILYYLRLLAAGVEPEDARYIIPNACKTELVMTINLRSLINLFEHRICSRTQWEFRDLAIEMYKSVKSFYPVVFKYHKFPNCFHCFEKCLNPVKGV